MTRAAASRITLQESLALKGLAVLLMFAHHLFGLPSLIRPPAEVVPLIPGVPLEYLLGRYGKVVVALFLFLTGYGLALKAGVSLGDQLRRLWRFVARFWFYFAIFVPIGILFFPEVELRGEPRYSADLYRLVTNALMLRHDYNYEWWFTEPYVMILLAAPLILRAVARAPRAALLVSVLAFGFGAVMDMRRLDPPLVSVSAGLIWQIPFVMGALAVRWPNALSVTAAAGLVSGLALVVLVLTVDSLAPAMMTPALIMTTPLTVVFWLWALRRLPRTQVPLAWLGGVTLPMWLVHSFYCYYFAQPLIYAPKLSVLVFLTLLATSLATVLPLEAIRRRLFKRLPGAS